jgi:hypothetical protein
MDFRAGVTYRIAYGIASRLVEARRHSARYDRHRVDAAAAAREAADTLAEVVRQLHVEDFGERELVAEALDDALEGRRPKWWTLTVKSTRPARPAPPPPGVRPRR